MLSSDTTDTLCILRLMVFHKGAVTWMRLSQKGRLSDNLPDANQGCWDDTSHLKWQVETVQSRNRDFLPLKWTSPIHDDIQDNICLVHRHMNEVTSTALSPLSYRISHCSKLCEQPCFKKSRYKNFRYRDVNKPRLSGPKGKDIKSVQYLVVWAQGSQELGSQALVFQQELKAQGSLQALREGVSPQALRALVSLNKTVSWFTFVLYGYKSDSHPYTVCYNNFAKDLSVIQINFEVHRLNGIYHSLAWDWGNSISSFSIKDDFGSLKN